MPKRRSRRRRRSVPFVQEVPHAMPEAGAAAFEVGFDAPRGSFRGQAGADTVTPAGCRFHRFTHVLGVRLPVRGEEQQAARRHARGKQLHEGGLDAAALVMTFLVPRIGEPDAHFGHAAWRDLVLQHFHRVVLVQAHIGRVALGQRVHHATHAGTMHFHADVIACEVVFAGPSQCFAGPEADLEYPRRMATERAVEIARHAAVVEPEARPVVVECTLLRRRHAAFAQHEAADAAMERGVARGLVVVRHRQPTSPSTGLEADAKRLRGMRPARNAARPASMASFMAWAISTGSFAPAMAEFISTPSQPSSIAMAASDAVPTPASTMTGTFAFSMISSRL